MGGPAYEWLLYQTAGEQTSYVFLVRLAHDLHGSSYIKQGRAKIETHIKKMTRGTNTDAGIKITLVALLMTVVKKQQHACRLPLIQLGGESSRFIRPRN